MNRPQKIIYLSNERFPAKLACTIQQIVMCESFAKVGAYVQLVAPIFFDTQAPSTAEIYAFYDVAPCFSIKRLFSLLSLSKPLMDGKRHLKIPLIGGLSLFISTIIYALILLMYGTLNQPHIIYSRNVIGAFVFLLLKQSVARRKPFTIFFEVHSLDQLNPKQFFHKLLRESDGLICITKALRDALIVNYGISPAKIFVAPDGVRENILHQPVLSKRELRDQLGISAEKIILYTGQLLPGKGADVFVKAAQYFDNSTSFILVGGHGEYMRQLQQYVRDRNVSNVTFTGFVQPAQVRLYQIAADVLVLPATADHDISAYTSPLKLFEYMAARRPIIASNLPVLSEVLQDKKNALYFQERDAADLARKIRLVLENPDLQERLTQRAWDQVQSFTWEERAKRIMKFMQNGTVV